MKEVIILAEFDTDNPERPYRYISSDLHEIPAVHTTEGGALSSGEVIIFAEADTVEAAATVLRRVKEIHGIVKARIANTRDELTQA